MSSPLTTSGTVSRAVRTRIGVLFPPLAQAPRDLEAVDSRQHQVQHDGVVFESLGHFERVAAIEAPG